jgi:hypothetical protein
MKKVARCVARKAMSGTLKYALVRKARGNAFVVHTTDQNCYHQMIGIVPTEVHFRSNVRSFLIFLSL